MKWDVEYTDEFESWWDRLNDMEQDSVQATAILLIGGDKTGHERWYQVHVPQAERLYDEHLETLKKEGYDNG
ncbi:hypothetical protein D3C85_1585000 [compost metagenome]